LENGVFFLNDLENRECHDSLHRIVPDAACALGARVAFSEKHYGAIVVLSDHQDLSPEYHGLILKVFAGQTAEILARREVLATTLGGLQRSIDHALRRLKVLIGNSSTEARDPETSNEISSLIQFAQHALDASVDLVRFDQIFPTCEPFNVREVITQAVQVVQAENTVGHEMHNNVHQCLEVKGQSEVFVLIMYSLLNNSWLPVDAPVRKN